jgi:lactate permease
MFGAMIEGAAGFGTPAALAGPLLWGLASLLLQQLWLL